MPTRQQVKEQIASEFKDILDATYKLGQTADDMKKIMNEKKLINEHMEKSKLAATFLFLEAYAQFLSVRILCEEAMSHMACIVLRSLFELIMYFKFIQDKDSEERAEKYLNWAYIEKYKLMNRIPSFYNGNEKKEIRNEYDRVKSMYVPAMGKKKKVPARYWHCFPGVCELAEDAGLKLLYEDYRILCKVVHVGTTYLLGRIRDRGKDYRIEYDPFFDEDTEDVKYMLRKNLTKNFDCFLWICRETNDMLSLEKSEVLDELVKQQNDFWKKLGIQESRPR